MTYQGAGAAMVPSDARRWRDLRFVADLAQRMRASSPLPPFADLDEQTVIRHRIACGTLDAALWILGITDLAPATGRICVDRTQVALIDEAAVASGQRRSSDPTTPQWLYMGGVLDALGFALGDAEPFWWVPLPEVMRLGPPRRDEYGREID